MCRLFGRDVRWISRSIQAGPIIIQAAEAAKNATGTLGGLGKAVREIVTGWMGYTAVIGVVLNGMRETAQQAREAAHAVAKLGKAQRDLAADRGAQATGIFSEITKISNNLNLPKNILETASVIYRKAVKEKLIRGRSIQGVTSAAIYLACRQCGLPRTLDEIAQSSGVNKKEVGRSYRFLIRELNYSIPPLRPSQYITKFSNQLTMQGKVEEIAHKILAAAKELKLTSGRGPTGIAAAASYVASVLTGERKTQREIAEIAQVTEVTIRNRYKELVERLMFQISI